MVAKATYQEIDRTNPLNVYKLAGEEAIRENCDRQSSAPAYGTHGKSNFVKTMLRLGAEREEIRVVDQIGSLDGRHSQCHRWVDSPTKKVPRAVPTITSNSGVASWYDFRCFEEARHLGFPQVQRVIPITTDYPTPAQRPTYSVLPVRKYLRF